MYLDYTIEDIEERKIVVNNYLSTNLEPSAKDLETLANYLVYCKYDIKEKELLPDNRKITIAKRETSYEGLTEKLEGGEDALVHKMRQDKNMRLSQKKTLTKKEIAAHRELSAIQCAIDALKCGPQKTGYAAYVIKQTIIDLYKDLYYIWTCLHPPVQSTKISFSKYPIHLEGYYLTDPKVIEGLLCNYTRFKGISYGDFDGDIWYIMLDFDNLLKKSLAQKPVYQSIVQKKIAGLTNDEIRDDIQLLYGLNYTKEYISSLWRNRIPEYIAEVAKEDYEEWLTTYVVKAKFKKCNRCGKVKLANTKYFSKDSSKKDGLYTLCKECRKESRLNAKKNV